MSRCQIHVYSEIFPSSGRPASPSHRHLHYPNQPFKVFVLQTIERHGQTIRGHVVGENLSQFKGLEVRHLGNDPLCR